MGAFSRIIFFTLHFSFSSFALFGQKIDDPGLYNNYIVDQQRKVIDKISNFTLTSVHDHNKDLSALRKDVLTQLDESINKLKGLSTMRGDYEFKNEAINQYL